LAEIVPVTSEALEAQVRDLLPSQRGFGEDLQASNVITPIIDLTNVAQGTNVPLYQQQALAFGSVTAIESTGSTVVIANTPGFWRIFGSGTARATTGVVNTVSMTMSDGLSTKNIYVLDIISTLSTAQFINEQLDFIVFLSAGESVSVVTTATASFNGCVRQVADVNGNPVNPSGFTPQ